MELKSKLILAAGIAVVLSVAVFGSYRFMQMERDNGKTTWSNWMDCVGEGQSLQRDSDYDFLWNTCVTIRVNEDGSETRVKASLDVGLEGLGG